MKAIALALALVSSLPIFAETKKWDCEGLWMNVIGSIPAAKLHASIETSDVMGTQHPMTVQINGITLSGTSIDGNPRTFVITSSHISIQGTFTVAHNYEKPGMSSLIRAKGSAEFLGIMTCDHPATIQR